MEVYQYFYLIQNHHQLLELHLHLLVKSNRNHDQLSNKFELCDPDFDPYSQTKESHIEIRVFLFQRRDHVVKALRVQRVKAAIVAYVDVDAGRAGLDAFLGRVADFLYRDRLVGVAAFAEKRAGDGGRDHHFLRDVPLGHRVNIRERAGERVQHFGHAIGLPGGFKTLAGYPFIDLLPFDFVVAHFVS